MTKKTRISERDLNSLLRRTEREPDKNVDCLINKGDLRMLIKEIQDLRIELFGPTPGEMECPAWTNERVEQVVSLIRKFEKESAKPKLPSAPDFEIGNRVKVRNTPTKYNKFLANFRGTVIFVNATRILVEFDDQKLTLHSGNRKGRAYHCWNFWKEGRSSVISDLQQL